MTTQAAQTRTRTQTNIRKIAVVAMLSALAAVIQLLEIPIPLIPSFVKLDFSELPALIASFVVSPWAGIPVCLVKNLIKLSTTSSAGVLSVYRSRGGGFKRISGNTAKHEKHSSGASDLQFAIYLCKNAFGFGNYICGI